MIDAGSLRIHHYGLDLVCACVVRHRRRDAPHEQFINCMVVDQEPEALAELLRALTGFASARCDRFLNPDSNNDFKQWVLVITENCVMCFETSLVDRFKGMTLKWILVIAVDLYRLWP